MIGPRNCALAACASSFPYKDGCGLVASGCCARDMLASLTRAGEQGCKFPLDLHLNGNPFVKAMVDAGMVRVRHDITQSLAA